MIKIIKDLGVVFLLFLKIMLKNFLNIYFNGKLNTEKLKVSGKLSPKILIVAPLKDFHGNIIKEEVKFGR